MLAGATTAAGQGFSGPWESTSEPPTIANAAVTTEAADDSFSLAISFAALAPGADHVVPITVTFSDPSGSESVSISPPVGEPCRSRMTLEDLQREGECHVAKWTQPAHNPQVDFTITTGDKQPNTGLATVGSGAEERFWQSASKVTFSPGVTGTPTKPFFYQVVGPSGVIAQAAMSVTQTPVETVHSHNLSPCLDSGSGLHSEGGELYCEQTVGGSYSFSDGGWPAPKTPATPTQPKPEYPALTKATAGLWVKTAVEYHFGYAPKHFRATRCAERATGRYRCKVSWRHGAYSFVGAAEVGEANVYKVTYNYGLRVVRTDVRTHHRRTLTVAY